MSRITIDIDDRHVALIMRRYGVHTRTEAVDLALRHLAGLPQVIDEALTMRGFDEVPEDRGP